MRFRFTSPHLGRSFLSGEVAMLKARAFDASPDALVIGRPGGRVLAVNAAASRMLGCTAREARRLRFAGLFDGEHARPGERPGDPDPGSVPVGRRTLGACRADGTRFLASVTFTALGRGRCAAIAARIRALPPLGRPDETEAGDVHLYAAEGPGWSGPLLARVGHELNNPLAIVLAQATVLHDRASDPEVARRADRIMSAAQRAGRIVEGLAASARQRAPEQSWTDVNVVLRDVVASLSRGMGIHGIEVRSDLAPDLPDVWADRDLLGQATANVLLIARQALADHRGERIVMIRTSVAGRAVAIDIADTAGGIPSASAEKTFELDPTARPAGEALGLGLFLSRAILAHHGGEISDLGAAGSGAGLRLTIPLPGAESFGAGRRTSLSVLVVDDERDVAEALADVIRLLGHECHVTTSADAALEAIRSRRFDAAIVDLHMPNLDGLALKNALSALDRRLADRIAIVTGDATGRASGDRAEPPFVLGKPFTLAGVRALLARMAAP